MPQQSLLEEHPAMSTLVMTIRSYPHTEHPDEVAVTTSIGYGSKPQFTVSHVLMRGLMRDYLNTLVEAATMAYMYGERGRDVARAIEGVRVLARAHAATHEF